jgi:RNA polymerase primary sigma factor
VRWEISTAKKYSCKFLFFEDLISVGNIGLIKAIDKFDSTRGCRFATYAYNWIWQAINREIMNKSREISIPCHEQEKIMSRLKKLNKTKFYSYYAYEREVKPVTISINSIYRHFEDNDIKVEDLISGIIDDNDVNSDIDNRSLVEDLLKNLTKLERNILKRRYGILDYGKIDTLKDIGTDYALSRERIRQLQSIAIKKIKEAANYGNEAS